MTDNMKKFLEEVSEDKEFINKVNRAETPEAIIALAAEKGFALTLEDIKPEERTGEVSDEELDAVAGGKTCVCVAGGGGEKDDAEKDCQCICVGIGQGLYGAKASTEDTVRCFCFGGGGGVSGE